LDRWKSGFPSNHFQEIESALQPPIAVEANGRILAPTLGNSAAVCIWHFTSDKDFSLSTLPATSEAFAQDDLTDKFVGSNQASATKVASLSITSANPATIRICMPQWSCVQETFRYLTMCMARLIVSGLFVIRPKSVAKLPAVATSQD